MVIQFLFVFVLFLECERGKLYFMIVCKKVLTGSCMPLSTKDDYFHSGLN